MSLNNLLKTATLMQTASSAVDPRVLPAIQDLNGSDVKVTSEVRTDSSQSLTINSGVALTQDFYGQNTNGGSSTTREFNSTFQTFTPAKNFMLNIPVKASFVNLSFFETGHETCPGLAANYDFSDILEYNRGQFANLQLINSSEVNAGSSALAVNIPVCKTHPGILAQAMIYAIKDDTLDYALGAGCPTAISNNFWQGTPGIEDTASKGNIVTLSKFHLPNEYERKIKLFWRDLYYQMLRQRGGIYLNATFDNELTTANRGTTETFYLQIPMAMISSFFATEGLLPAGVAYKITINFNPNPVTVFRLDHGSTAAQKMSAYINLTIDQNMPWTTSVRGVTFTPAITQQFNTKFQSIPCSFYESDFDAVTIPFRGNTLFNEILQLNLGFPTQIFFFVSSNSDIGEIAIYKQAGDTNNVFNSMQWGKNLVPFHMSELRILSGGTIIYDDKKVVKDYANYIYTNSVADRSIFSLNNDYYFKNSYAYENELKITTSARQNDYLYPFVVTLDGDMPHEDRYSVPTGQTQITMSATITRPDGSAFPNAGYSLIALTRRPKNISISGTGEVQMFQYPNIRVGSIMNETQTRSTSNGLVNNAPAINNY